MKGRTVMKKLTALLLAAAMIFALCACGGNDKPAETEGNAQMVNPMVEVDDVELQNSLGVALNAPEGATDIKYFLINEVLGEVQFDYNGAEYSYRAQKTDKLEDISGAYFNEPEAVNSDGVCTITVEKDGSLGAATWYADGFSYAISMGEGAAAKSLMAMYDLLTA